MQRTSRAPNSRSSEAELSELKRAANSHTNEFDRLGAARAGEQPLGVETRSEYQGCRTAKFEAAVNLEEAELSELKRAANSYADGFDSLGPRRGEQPVNSNWRTRRLRVVPPKTRARSFTLPK